MNSGKKYRKRNLEAHNIERIYFLSALLCEHRLWLGYSRVDMEQFGISRSVIQRAESSSDPANLTLKTVFELADVYQISPEELFAGVE